MVTIDGCEQAKSCTVDLKSAVFFVWKSLISAVNVHKDQASFVKVENEGVSWTEGLN